MKIHAHRQGREQRRQNEWLSKRRKEPANKKDCRRGTAHLFFFLWSFDFLFRSFTFTFFLSPISISTSISHFPQTQPTHLTPHHGQCLHSQICCQEHNPVTVCPHLTPHSVCPTLAPSILPPLPTWNWRETRAQLDSRNDTHAPISFNKLTETLIPFAPPGKTFPRDIRISRSKCALRPRTTHGDPAVPR